MIAARADIVANVWKIVVREGDPVNAGDELAVLESMKMEIPVIAPSGGYVVRIPVDEGQIVQEGDVVVEIDGTPGV
ncbi:biotin/lipoyl-binding carrier protein [Aeromicrobium sp. Leaf350]|uniref:biotin/lipoyl-binding carrier protein n=1 Tax=Aeromicrobium sp. Leaf350 TaxID=2876565 RepID=UPI001E569E25|nr:biotin/lipoyl-binding carrier protein [Aeromicrobium sp. Leaf350]